MAKRFILILFTATLMIMSCKSESIVYLTRDISPESLVNICMASNPDFVQYIIDQCAGVGEIAVKKMMGL